MRSERGYALVIVVVFTAVLLVAGGAAIQMTRFELHGGADQTARTQALYIAEAGVQRALAQLAWDRDFAANYTTYRVPSSGTRSEAYDNGMYSFSIQQDPDFPTDPRRKLITSTGTRLGQSAQVVSHADVQPSSSTCCQTPTPTAGAPAPPTAGVPDEIPGTPTPGPTDTPEVHATATPTATPNEGSPLGRVCDSDVILASYGGTARLINTAAVASEVFNGTIFSNDDVAFQLNVAGVAITASGKVQAGGDFINEGTGLNVLSNLSATLEYEGSYQKAALDSTLTHIICNLLFVCAGVHFGNFSPPQHGTDVGPGGIPDARAWQPEWRRLRRNATYVVTRESQPFGSWDDSSGTWVVNTHTFPSGSTDLFFVEGNVKITGISLTRSASPTIAARGWISLQSITVLASGLLGTDVQNVNLIGEGDVGVGRTILSMDTGVFETVATAINSIGSIGVNLAAVAHRTNLVAYSQRGEAFIRFGTVDAASRFRACVLAEGDATIARTAGALSTIRPIDS